MTDIVEKYIFDYEVDIVRDKELQIDGIDAIADGVAIDFKFQVGDRYVGNPTDTFSLELQTDNRYGESMIGWFLDDTKKTDAYGFVWVHKGTINPFTVQKIEYMQVDVKKLKEYVFSKISTDVLSKYINKLYGYKDYCFVSEFKIVSSGQLFEKPINLIVKKDILKKFATKHCFVTVS